MLTRSQVANKLGRSLATVRRLEGHTLHPTKDANGVNRFDDSEVAAAAVKLSRQARDDLSVNPFSTRDTESKRDDLVDELRAQLDDVDRKLTTQTDRAELAERRLSAFERTIASELIHLTRLHPEASQSIERTLRRLSRL